MTILLFGIYHSPGMKERDSMKNQCIHNNSGGMNGNASGVNTDSGKMNSDSGHDAKSRYFPP